MTYKCKVIIQREDDWYVASCLENNVASQGKNIDEALANLKEAVALYYEDDSQTQMYVTAF
ncbi:antitoxin HicB [Candidatus Termititenax persephonae]|uniref:Antitoxin HicB n=1 Tax=Candidatus Termititenax persephonae TaxID=2218525 RepID=A0A388TJF3_9BACT|nr:antitoxin HicB [Candidatus Termititenax persephonae]